MSNDFEKDISQRMQDFSITPQPEIWQRVEAALPPEKKRRFALWWWLLPLLGLLAGGIWIISSQQKNTAANKSKQLPIAQTTLPPIAAPKLIDTPAQPVSQLKRADDIPVSQPTALAETQQPTREKPAFTLSKDKNLPAALSTKSPQKLEPQSNPGNATKNDPQFMLAAGKSYSKQTTPAEPVQNASADNNSSTVNATTASTIPIATTGFIQAKKDTINAIDSARLVLQKIDTATTVPPDSAATGKTATAKKSAFPQKPSVWMLEVGAGISNQRFFSGGSNGGQFERLYTLDQSNGSLYNPPATGQLFTLPRSSYTFNIGIVRKHFFTPHWQGALSVRYQLLSNTQQYGTYIGATGGTNFSNDSANRLYSTGNRQLYHNYVHQLQVAPKIAYIFNPKAVFPIDFHTGFSIAYNLASNQLLHDYRTRNYIRSAEYTTRWLLAVEVGAGIFIRQKIHAGLSYQYELSNVARPALQSNFRWRVWQVQVGIPLFNHPSK